jgi:hypothetical protein
MQDLIDKIYLVMGVDVETLPLEVVEHFLNEWLLVYPTNECLALYNTIVSCYEWLIKQSAAEDASDGVVKREKEAGVEVEMFERKSGENTQMWVTALERFEQNPTLSLPSCREQFTTLNTGRVIVGGVNTTTIKSIRNNRKIRTGGASELTGVDTVRYPRGRRGSFRLP